MNITDEELGACCDCPHYNCFGAHGRSPEGALLISCKRQKGLISPKTSISNHENCDRYGSYQASHTEAA